MRIHILHREQTLPGTPDEVFPFFADAHNLEAITPPLLRFRIVTPDPIENPTQVSFTPDGDQLVVSIKDGPVAGLLPDFTPDGIEMRVGTLIQYRLRLHGIPVSWLTSIQAWEPPYRFVDQQVRGPYALWHHTHTFVDDGAGGTRMTDTVRYALPFSPLGDLALPLVRRDLRTIFDHRRDEVARRVQPAGDARPAPAR